MFTAIFPPSSGRAWQGEAAGVHVHPGGAGPAEDARPSHTLPLGLASPRGAREDAVAAAQRPRTKVRMFL